MRAIHELKTKIAEARAEYQALSEKGAPPTALRDASTRVRVLQAALSSAITQGAKPCPRCKAAPHGIQQPSGGRKGGTEYEVGCLAHPELSVRGGLLPRHAVEMWNELVAETPGPS